jgi:group I intron endonuclease
VDLSKRILLYYNHINGRGRNMLINRALLKYGYSNFSLEILEYCEPDKCIEREQYYIDRLKPEYNILKTAGSSLGYLHSDEAKQKMSEAKSGKTLSENTIKKISEAKLGKTLSEETRKKISDTKKGKPRPDGAGRPSQQRSPPSCARGA